MIKILGCANRLILQSIIIGSLFSPCHAATGDSSVDEAIQLIYQGNPQKALSLLQKPIEAGDERALFYAALVHLFGDNPQTDLGMPLLEKAVHKGYCPALDTYAGLYLHGDFVPQDSHKALMYYEMSAKRGYGPSQFNCGIIYKNGEKIPRDLEKAFYFLSLAANNRQDLDELADDAAQFRNDVVAAMSKEEYQRALQAFGGRPQ